MVCLAASLNLLKLVHFMVKKYSWRFNELLSDHSIGTSDGLLTLIHRYKYIQYESVTVLSGKACERGQIAGLGSLFFRICEQLIFGEFFQSFAKFAFLSGFHFENFRCFDFNHGTEKFYFEPKSG